MILKSVRLQNFRGYINEVIQFDSKMNVIIGRNDAGKSTILEALEIFFNSDQIKIEDFDKNVFCNADDKIRITCVFQVDPKGEIILDSTNPTTLEQEYLLNKEGCLEIEKEWNCTGALSINKTNKTYIVSEYPNISEKPLINQKIPELKKTLKEVSPNLYDSIDKSRSSEIRRAIYNEFDCSSENLVTSKIDISQEEARDIWKKISKDLPIFFLFKSDRINSDKDSEVQSPMKAITKAVVSSLQDEINEIIKTVKLKVEEMGNETIKKLAELDSTIAKDLKPNINHKSMESIFSFDLISDNNVPLNKRGSGVRRLVLLSFFRVEAERKITDGNNSIIYAIEEPETSQHPHYQRMIMETLLELSSDDKHQIIITSHTPEIAKMVNIDQLIFISKDGDGAPKLEKEIDKKCANIVSALGVLPYAVTNSVICVEGVNDVKFIKNLNKIPEFNSIINLEDERIEILPLNGSNLVGWVSSNYFAESNIKEIHLYDNDRKEYKEIINKINAVDDKRRFGNLTKLNEIENYIPYKLVEEEFGVGLTQYYDSWKEIDIPKTLLGKVLKEIPNEKRENVIKEILNGRIARKITADMLKEMKTFEEWEIFFKKVRDIHTGTFIKKVKIQE